MMSLQIGYAALSLAVTTVILLGYRAALKKSGNSVGESNRRTLLALGGVLLWWLYTYFIAESGIIKDLSLPPRMPILLIFPVFLFTGIVLFRGRSSAILKAMPLSWPIYFQAFRILVESLFVSSVAAGILHREVTIEGYNFDMVFACTAPIVGYLVFQVQKLPLRFVLYWNYLGLAVIASIIFLFTTTLYFPQFWGHARSVAPTDFLDFPYVLVASYLMPTAVFVHIFSIVQLRHAIK